MGCVHAKPLVGSEAAGLERLKLENGYVDSRDFNFVAPRRSTGQRFDEHGDNNGGLYRRVSRKHRADLGIANEEKRGSGNDSEKLRNKEEKMSNKEGKKRNAANYSEKFLNDDDMVDGWPRWLVDNVPREVLAGLVPKSAESYKMIDKVFISSLC